MGVVLVMAKFEIGGLLETAQMFDRLATNSESVAKQAVGAGASILADQVAKNLADSIAKGATARSERHYTLTGDLQRSLGVTSVKKDKHGVWNAKVGFDGYGKDGRPLPLVARALESGTSKQKKRPFLRPAVQQKEAEIQTEMDKLITSAIEKEQR